MEDEEDSFVDDDYFSLRSGDDEATDAAVVEAFAFRQKGKKKGKGKGKRKGPMPSNNRNRDDNIPEGWSREKWLARTPCPDCGSRWHRRCNNKKGATRKGKGGGKGFGETMENKSMQSPRNAP